MASKITRKDYLKGTAGGLLSLALLSKFGTSAQASPVTDNLHSTGSSAGGGSTVEWNQIQDSGNKIAEIIIDGAQVDVYSPICGSSEGTTGESIELTNVMTSNEDIDGVVTCSSEFTSSYSAWMAFNGVSCNTDCSNGWLASSSDEQPYIQYEFKKGTRRFECVIIETYNNSTDLIRNVAIQTSNDGVVWEDIGASQVEFKTATYGTVEIPITNLNYWKFIRLQFDGRLYLGTYQSAGALSKIKLYGYTGVTLESVNTKLDNLLSVLKEKNIVD